MNLSPSYYQILGTLQFSYLSNKQPFIKHCGTMNNMIGWILVNLLSSTVPILLSDTGAGLRLRVCHQQKPSQILT